MGNQLEAKCPASIWRKDVTGDLKVVLKHVVKGAFNIARLDPENILTQGTEALKDFGLKDSAGECLLQFLLSAATMAAQKLLFDTPRLQHTPHEARSDLATAMAEAIAKEAEQQTLAVDQAFLETPREHLPFSAVHTVLQPWLHDRLGDKLAAEWTVTRFAVTFEAMWFAVCAKDLERYTTILKGVGVSENDIASRATPNALAWNRYNALLQLQPRLPMMGEAFGLDAVYISLRGYYEGNDTDNQKQQHVVWLDKSIDAWLASPNIRDALRIVCGGPGSGKSSFTKMLAARLATSYATTGWRVLFVPLHRLQNLERSFDKALRGYVQAAELLPFDPLNESRDPLLVILDGLDELAMEDGTRGVEAAKLYVAKVIKSLKAYNSQRARLKVLVSGRDLVVQGATQELRQANMGTDQSMLHVLPYVITSKDVPNAVDPDDLRGKDQRTVWWEHYGKATGRAATGMPEELDTEGLFEMTRRPLLGYLVARLHARTPLSQEESRVSIYEKLLAEVHRRDWDEGGPGHPLDKDSFFQVLEEVAVCVWHNGAGIATLKDVEKRVCGNSQCVKALETIADGAKKQSLGTILLAFYFRHGLGDTSTIEFTHKTFWEYLTARSIVRTFRQMHEEKMNLGSAKWNPQASLETWIGLCCAQNMDQDMYDYVKELVAEEPQKTLVKWQELCAALLSYTVVHGMPMGARPESLSFKAQCQQARNAEIALLAMHCACATKTQQRTALPWPDEQGFHAWLAWLEPVWGTGLTGRLLQGLVLEEQNLQGENLNHADLSRADLRGADLRRATLSGADLRGADLNGAALGLAALGLADLGLAALGFADLRGADLRRANFNGADLSGADLRGADLGRADLSGADLSGADLRRATLHDAIVTNALLKYANVECEALAKAYFDDPALSEALAIGIDLAELPEYRIGSPTSEQVAALETLVTKTKAAEAQK